MVPSFPIALPCPYCGRLPASIGAPITKTESSRTPANDTIRLSLTRRKPNLP